ncbi:hypothetical protein Scep_006121 [Stephania cephalantha]|uniref:Uncharacterized protein n=1 Tax=Stephania cephalantha TaxID=152367 RepID=A0AAP0K9A6_9MAGN
MTRNDQRSLSIIENRFVLREMNLSSGSYSLSIDRSFDLSIVVLQSEGPMECAR